MEGTSSARRFGTSESGPWTGREIEQALSEPTPGAIDAARRLEGDHVVLGASGKMGVTLSAMIRRALDAAGKKSTRVMGVARFRDPDSLALLRHFGVEPIPCDLADYDAVAKLPPAANVQYLSGQKFGTESAPEDTWVQNTVVPSHVARRFRDSRIVVFSTGCVYPFSPADGLGANEDTALGFLGEYATTCIGRERIFTHYSKRFGTKMLLFRLNYSVEFRYGVLADIGQRVIQGLPVDLNVSVANVIWQRDACARAVQSLLHVESPPKKLNVTGVERVEVRAAAEKFGAIFGKKPVFTGTPQPSVWLVDSRQSVRLFGPLLVNLDTMIEGVASYLAADGRLLGKPTHFEVIDGRF
jgi:nucleoside-diphosphate-sugar epimerase